MDSKISQLTAARASRWSGSGALQWNVTGFGSERPFVVKVKQLDQLKHAIALINHELREVRDLIRRKRISLPARAIIDSFSEPIEVDGPSPTESIAFDISKHQKRSKPVLELLQLIDFNLRNRDRRRRLNEILDELSRTIERGRIVIVAEAFLYEVLLEFVRDKPRFTVLQAGYGASASTSGEYLRKPASKSLLSWLCTYGLDAEAPGAIALFGASSFELDIGAIRDALNVGIFRISPTAAPSHWRVELVPFADMQAAADLPKISIVTVSFNQAAYLERTIESVLKQGYPNLEYVIVDGGSTDGSTKIIDRYSEHFASVVVEPDKGQSDALNKGFRLTSGEVMNWLCSDDLLEPDALHRIAETYVAHKPDLIVGGCVRIGEEREVELARHHTAILMGDTVPLDPFDMIRFMGSWQRGHYFFQPEVFFSRRIWNAAGAFIKPHLFYAMDYDMWLRMALAGATIRHIPSFLGCSRVHAAQKTQSNQYYLPQIEQIMNEYKELFGRLLSSPGPATAS